MTGRSSRPDPGIWSSRPDPGTLAAIRELVAAARSADGIEPLGGHVLEGLGGADTRLTTDIVVSTVQDGGVTVGVAVRHGDDPAELVVHPDHRGRGLGRVLLARSLEAAGRVWAHGDLPAARTLAGSLGLTPSRTLLQWRRDLPVPGEVVLPAGVRIRAFVPGQDDEQFLGVNARAFDWHPEQGRLDAAGLAAEIAQDWFDPAGFFLAVTDEQPPPGATERVLGFHWIKVHPADPTPQRPGDPAVPQPGPVGEVYVLGVDPLSPVRRLGIPLTQAGLDHLAELGLGTVMLYVEGDNVAALALYRRLGFADWITDRVYAAGP